MWDYGGCIVKGIMIEYFIKYTKEGNRTIERSIEYYNLEPYCTVEWGNTDYEAYWKCVRWQTSAECYCPNEILSWVWFIR